MFLFVLCVGDCVRRFLLFFFKAKANQKSYDYFQARAAMELGDGGGDKPGDSGGEKRDIRRPMNAFLIFCKRHRSMVREKHPDRDNRSVTRILGDLWANLAEDEKAVYTNLAKQVRTEAGGRVSARADSVNYT